MADLFDIDASREDYVTCLQQVLNGTRNPSNILDYVNPFASHPKNLPDGILFLGIFDLSERNGGGYWQQSGEEARIVTISFTAGWMKKLEFFEGQAPHALRTDWAMQVYRLDDHNRQLCRIWEQINGDDDDIGQVLYEMLARDPPNSQNNSNGSQVVSGNERGSPDRNPSIDDGYLELNDLVGYESFTSSGENSSRMAITSDDYMADDFNSEASLSDQESRTGPVPQQNLSRCTALPTLPLSGVQGGEQKGHKDIRVPPKSATPESKTLGGPSVSVPPTANRGSLQTGLGEPQARPSTLAPQGEKKQGSKMAKSRKKFCCCLPL